MKSLRPLYLALYYPILVLAQLLARLFFPVKAYGREHLPRQGYVLAPNHIAAIDPFFVLLARGFKKKMIIMGKEELFQINGLLNFFWNIAGAFPVDRGTGNRRAVDEAVEAVRGGRGLLLFPEGTRSKDGALGRLKSGAFVVAQEAGAAMIPCVIWYAAGRPKIFRRTHVAFGPPLPQLEMGPAGERSAKKLREAKTLYAQKLKEIKEEYAP